MTNWIITSSVLILIMIAARKFLKGHISPLLQYGLWLIVLARLIIPLNPFESSISVLNAVPQNLTAAETVTIGHTENTKAEVTLTPSITATEAVISDAPETAAPVTAQSVLPSLSFVLGTLWLTGMAGILIYAAIRNARLARFLKRTRLPFSDGIYLAAALPSSCLFGVLKPRIYITEAVAYNPLALEHVLAHEQAHRRHGDHIWNLLRIGVLALHWYNPLVWWACALSKRDAEMAADAAAIASLTPGERFNYGETLLNMLDCAASRDTWFSCSTTMITTKRALRERISAIVKNAHTAVSMAVVVLLTALAMVGCTFTGASDDANSAESASDKESIVSKYASLSPYELQMTPIIAQDTFDLMTEWLRTYHDISTEDATETLTLWIEESESLTPDMIEDAKMIQTSDGCYVGYIKHGMMQIKDIRAFVSEMETKLDMNSSCEHLSGSPHITEFYLSKQEQFFSYYQYFDLPKDLILYETDPRVTDPKYVEPVLAYENSLNTGRDLVDTYAEWITLETDMTYEEISDQLPEILTDTAIATEKITDHYLLKLSDGSMIGYLAYSSDFPSKSIDAITKNISDYAVSMNFISSSTINQHPNEIVFSIYPDVSHLLNDYFYLHGTIRRIDLYKPYDFE